MLVKLLATAVLLISSVTTHARSSVTTLDPVQLEVIRVALETVTAGDGVVMLTLTTDTPISILRQFETSSGDLSLPSSTNGAASIDAELWRRFQRLNARHQDLDILPTVSGVLLVDDARLRRLLPDSSSASWGSLRNEVGARAIVRLTIPAVRNGSAVLYMNVTRGPLAGEGIVYVFKRVTKRWQLVGQYVVIAS